MTGKKLDHVPSAKTYGEWAIQFGILSDYQTGETMYNTKNLSLGWDSTPIDGNSLNEIHISSPGPPITNQILQIVNLPGGRAQDYFESINRAITDISSIYSEYQNLNLKETKVKILSNITNVLTDRVNTNHACTQLLINELEMNVFELNCNEHPVDGIAKATIKVCKKIDKDLDVKSNVYGSSACVENFIYLMCKLRFTQDPKGVISLLTKEQLNLKFIPRYVGNRFNVLFELALVFICHQDMFLKYLENECPCKQIRAALLQDYNNQIICTQLLALAFLAKIIVHPYTATVYGGNLTNLESIPYLQMCVDKIRHFIKNPNQLFLASTTVFGKELNNNYGRVSFLKSVERTENLINFTNQILQEMEITLSRQLKDYIDGGKLTNLSPENVEKCKSAASHAMFAEGALSLVTSQKARCPNVRTIYVETKVKTKKNKTLNWLNSKPKDEQEKLIAFATKKTQSVLCIRQMRERTIELEIKTRIEEKEVINNQKSIKSVQTSIGHIITKAKNCPLSELPTEFQVAAVVECTPNFKHELTEETLEFCSISIDFPKELAKIKPFHEYVTDKDTNITTKMMARITKVTSAKIPNVYITNWLPKQSHYSTDPKKVPLHVFISSVITGKIADIC